MSAADRLATFAEPTLREQLKNGRVLWSDQARKLIALGDKLADAAEALEQNPLANCLPRYRYPVVDAVAEWREALDTPPKPKRVPEVTPSTLLDGY